MSNDIRQDLKARTKEYSLRIIKLYASLPKRAEAMILGKQLLRSGTSVGAHYREAQRAKSTADFISKIEGASQELEESEYWLELLADSRLVDPKRLHDLRRETSELIAIFITIARNTKAKR